MAKQIKLEALHAGQKAIYEAANRFILAVIGRRWGKTHLMTYIAVMTLVKADNQQVGYFTPKYTHTDKVFSQIEKYLKPLIQISNRSSKQIVLVNGSRIKFWTLQDKDAGRGEAYHVAIIDEAGLIESMLSTLREAIMPTLRDYMGTLYVVGTPKGVGTAFHELYQETVDNKDWKVFTAPSTENPYVPTDDLEEERTILGSDVFEQEYEAKWIDRDGVTIVKPEWIQEIDRQKEYFTYALGIDPAVTSNEHSDATGIVLMGWEEHSKQMHVIEDYSRKVNPEQLANLVKSVIEECGHKFGFVFIETNQGGDYLRNALVLGGVESFRIKEVRATKGKHERLKEITPFLQAGKLRFACDAPALRNELLAFTYEGYPKRLGSPDRADAFVHVIKGMLVTYNMKEFLNLTGIYNIRGE